MEIPENVYLGYCIGKKCSQITFDHFVGKCGTIWGDSYNFSSTVNLDFAVVVC